MIEHSGFLLLAYSSVYILSSEFCSAAVTLSYLSLNSRGMKEWLIGSLIGKGHQQNVGGRERGQLCVCQLWMKALPKKYCKGGGASRTVILHLGHMPGSPRDPWRIPGPRPHPRTSGTVTGRKDGYCVGILAAWCMSLAYLRKKYRQWITGFFGGYRGRNGPSFPQGQKSSP